MNDITRSGYGGASGDAPIPDPYGIACSLNEVKGPSFSFFTVDAGSGEQFHCHPAFRYLYTQRMSTIPKAYLYRRVVQAKLYIDANYSSPIDLDNIADEAAFSKFHFIRLFREIYGQTPHQYLIAVRIEKARQLLADGNSVSQTCTGVGFDSLSSFSGLFKRLTGTSPSAYLRGQQDRKQKIAAQPLGYIPNCFAEAKGWK